MLARPSSEESGVACRWRLCWLLCCSKESFASAWWHGFGGCRSVTNGVAVQREPPSVTMREVISTSPMITPRQSEGDDDLEEGGGDGGGVGEAAENGRKN